MLDRNVWGRRMIKIKIIVDSAGCFQDVEVEKPLHIDFDLVVEEVQEEE
jgi:hypothetical protein